MSALRFIVVILLVANLVLLSMAQGWISQGGGSEPERLRSQISPDKLRIIEPRPEAGNATKLAAPSQVEPPGVTATPAPPPAPGVTAVPPAAANEQKTAVSEPPSNAKSAPTPSNPTANPSTAAAPPSPSEAAPLPQAAPVPAVTPAAVSAKMPPSESNENTKAAPPAKPQVVCRAIPALGENLARKGGDIARAQSGIKVSVSEPTDAPTAWWVHVPAVADRKEAETKAGELRGLGVKELYIRNEAGPEKNAISLGLYKSEKSARDFLAQLKSQGVSDAVITPRAAPDTKRTLTLTGNSNAVEATIAKMANSLGGSLRTTACPAP